MKQQQWTEAERAPRLGGQSHPQQRTATRNPIGIVRPKLTKLVTTKLVSLRPRPTDVRTQERDRLLAALLAARGRVAISQAFDALLAAGHALPVEQEPLLQLLEHRDEGRVREAIAALDALLRKEPAKHRPILEQRLTRLEESADEPSTRSAAASFRRLIR